MNIANWIIEDAPSYTRMRYSFVHSDYDGPEDNRCGYANSIEEVLELIKEFDEE